MGGKKKIWNFISENLRPADKYDKFGSINYTNNLQQKRWKNGQKSQGEGGGGQRERGKAEYERKKNEKKKEIYLTHLEWKHESSHVVENLSHDSFRRRYDRQDIRDAQERNKYQKRFRCFSILLSLSVVCRPQFRY